MNKLNKKRGESEMGGETSDANDTKKWEIWKNEVVEVVKNTWNHSKKEQ